jgi:membrane protease YdiL (CAAX protease family)
VQEPDPLPIEQTERPPNKRARWLVHLLILTAYPVTLGVFAAVNQSSNSTPMLPTEIGALLKALSVEVVAFSVIFGLAILASRPNREELFLRWNRRLPTLVRGFVYSIALRASLFALMAAIAAVAYAVTGGNSQLASHLQPDTEHLVNAKALVENPAYFLLNITLVSFVFAGFREELWRAGMLAGFNALLPGGLSHPAGRWLAIGFTAIVFGLGHLPQGWGGVLLTGALGIGLGMIIVRRRSIWEAVLAHGFFDATTFVLLYLVARFQPGWINGAH